jgi:D-alanine transaminase
MIAYFNGRYLPKEEVHISPDDRGFLLADGVYEVIRSYGGQLFRCADHLRRLSTGLAALQIPDVSSDELQRVAGRLLEMNELTSSEATVYLQVTRGVAPRRHRFPEPGTPPSVYATARQFQPYAKEFADGGAAILVPDQRWARCEIKTIGLLANAMANQRAWEAGAFEALFVRDGVVLEGSHSNVFFIRDGQLLTAPLNNHVLPGITREAVIAIAVELGLSVQLRKCFESEIADMDEIFICGTTVEITPIVTLDGKPVGHRVPGPVVRRLQQEWKKLTGPSPDLPKNSSPVRSS